MEASRPVQGLQRGSVLAWVGGALAIATWLLVACAAEPPERASPRSEVRPGVLVLLSDSLHLVRGRRVGLITNHTGIARRPPAVAAEGGEPTREVVSTIELLHDHVEVELVALYAAEHGLAGQAEAGEPIPASQHEATGLPIYSLYGENRKPLPRSLEGVEVLLYDLQDIGARYYTYIWTMALALEAAAETGIPFVVLDRPNPLGGIQVQGNVLEPAFASFVGLLPIPMRHGMTPGELGRLFRGEFGIQAELHVVPAQGWRRDLWFDETGLPWVPPSPNMPSLESATHYPGTCLFEGTNLSVGRGTEIPFQVIGAPWLDAEVLARRLASRGLPGVRIEPTIFVPRSPGDGKYAGEAVRGVRFTMTDRDAYDPTATGAAALLEARRLAGSRWEWRPEHFDRLAGTDALRAAIEANAPLEAILAAWRTPRTRFERTRRKYLIYGVR